MPTFKSEISQELNLEFNLNLKPEFKKVIHEPQKIIPPKKSSTEFGRLIEEKAKEFLSQLDGMRFLDKNVNYYGRFKKGEIDLIYLDEVEKSLVFIEVRARNHSNVYGLAEESLDGLKRYHLKSAIEWYYRRNKNKFPRDLKGIRVDLLAYNGERFNWIKNITL